MSQLSIPTTTDFLGRSNSEPPIVVDLDQTLISTDLLVETFFVMLASRPDAAFAALTIICNEGKAAFKSKLVEAAILDITAHPSNQEVLAFLNVERAKGRLVYLASALNRSYVNRVADHLGEGVLVLNAGIDLAGPMKEHRPCEEFGQREFDYIGYGSIDKAAWQHARRICLHRDVRCARI